MNERYIAVSVGVLGGEWGAGDTADKAKRKLRAVGGKVKGCKVYKFTSELPFAPSARQALEHEADCWVDRYGQMNWVRCHREELGAPV